MEFVNYNPKKEKGLYNDVYLKRSSVLLPDETPIPPVSTPESKSIKFNHKRIVFVSCFIVLLTIGAVFAAWFITKQPEKEEAFNNDFSYNYNENENENNDAPTTSSEFVYTENSQYEEEIFNDIPGEMIEDQQYILPFSNTRYLTYNDLLGFTAEDCRLARNEIYARHGRIFLDEGLQVYFESKSWYNPSVAPENFSESVFNEYEVANRDFIIKYESEQGYR